MFQLSFVNAALLSGLLALSVPILIHLLLKRKKKRLRFSTIQFFVKQDEQSTKRRQLRNLLLLAMRLLLFALLVFAFARPFFPETQATGGARKRRDVVFVVDRSVSMQATGVDGARWATAKEMVRKVLADLGVDDRAALISCATHTDVLSPFAPASIVSKALAELQPTFGTSDVALGLQQAVRLLDLDDRSRTATIYVVSDLQRAACRNVMSHPLPQEVEVKLLSAGDLFTPNVAITDLKLEGEVVTRPQAVIANYSDEERNGLKASCLIDGKEALARTFNLKAGSSTNLELALPALKPGWHGLEVRLEAKDALNADNVRYQSVFIREPARVLVTESRKTKRSFEEESFFVTAALNPGSDATNSVQASFVLEKISPDDLINRLTPRQGKLPLDCVMLPGLKQVPAGAGKALQSYVEAGGGVLLFVGEGISANRYNSEFRDLLPAQLGVPEASSEGLPWRIADYDTNAVMFAAFRAPGSGNLSLAEFTKRWTLATNGSSLVTARFQDGVPLVVSRTIGQGRVVLVNTSADTSWTDWPKHKSFVPWMQSVGRFLANNNSATPIQEAASFVAGGDTDLELGPNASKLQLKLRRPDGKEAAVVADEQGTLKDIVDATPGIYSVSDPAGKELQRFAVNFPAEESDLAAMSPTEFQRKLVRTQEPRTTTRAAGLFGQTSNQKEIWRTLLLAALALLMIEMFWSNRTRA